jgi:hypothetical protein
MEPAVAATVLPVHATQAVLSALLLVPAAQVDICPLE